MGKTTIAISAQTRNLLSENGKKGETYDDIILRLLKGKEQNDLSN